MHDESITPRRAAGVLALILVAGAYLRWLPASGTSFEAIIGGDSLEYQLLAQFFLDSTASPPGNRFPGFPFLLAALFHLLPFSHAAIQIVTTLALAVGGIALAYALAARLGGRVVGLLVAGLAAAHPHMVHNAHRGLTEELFLVLLLALLLGCHHTAGQPPGQWRWYLILAVAAGAMALVRPDSAYAVLPVFLLFAWRERSRGVLAMATTLPLIVLPFALPSLCQSWMESLGIQNMNMRAGRGILWMEFMLGRMPYQYMFYKETHVRDWLLGHHDFGQLVVLALKSSVRNLLGLGQAVGGQLGLGVVLAGIVGYVRQRRDLVLPLAIPLAILPQWGLVALWPEVDVERYNIRVVPLLLIFLLLGTWQVAAWIRARWSVAGPLARWLPMGVLIAVLSPALLPWSLAGYVRPSVDILYHERQNYLPGVSEVHGKLVDIWHRMAQRQLPLSDATDASVQLLEANEAYAPTHFVIGVLAVQQGQRQQAIVSLQRAVEIVPFFAEAAVLLAELYLLEDRRDEAAALLENTSRLRPDYPLVQLLAGHVRMIEGDLVAAHDAYEGFLARNRYQYERALFRQERILKRQGSSTHEVDQARLLIERDEVGLTTPLVWDYLSLDLNGIAMPPPGDHTVYFNLGVCDVRNGMPDSAEARWQTMTRLDAGHADSWYNLGQLQAGQGRFDEARSSWQQALTAEPGHALATESLRLGTDAAASGRYAPVRIVLPMTRSVL